MEENINLFTVFMVKPKIYDTLYSQAGTWRQNTEKNIFIV